MKKKEIPSAPAIDMEAVRALARIVEEFNLAEVEADPSGHIRVRRVAVAEAAMLGAPGTPAALALAPPPIALAPAPGGDGATEAGTFVSSPFVGTFYRSPSPDADPFVEVGQSVRKGQVVCIVEAMKLMNEIESETDGKVLEILVKNGEHVEYGQHLLRLAK
jgi:acetyl-CoA carboxylase biotin carboxyl carrier protein